MDRLSPPASSLASPRPLRPRLAWEIGAALAGLLIGAGLSFAVAPGHPPSAHARTAPR